MTAKLSRLWTNYLARSDFLAAGIPSAAQTFLMSKPIQFKTATLLVENLITCKSSLFAAGRRFILILTALVWFAHSPSARAVSPAPDGGYPNRNTAEGDDALFSLQTGSDNTAVGFDALYSDTDGGANTANGSWALFSNTFGGGNTAVGWQALYSNVTGSLNTAIGDSAAFGNAGGVQNTASGAYALFFGGGDSNTANGTEALFNTTGSNNIAVGNFAGYNLTTGSNNIDIGNQGVDDDSNTTRIGTTGTQTNAFMAGIFEVVVTKSTPVYVDKQGHLGTKPSSERFKTDIKPMDKASEAILALKPITFRYKKELDPDAVPQFGLVAEDVAKVDPSLVLRDGDGKTYTVRYEAVNAMLLNEFLKEHRKVEELKKDFQTTIARQQKQIQSLAASLKKQAVQIQKVGARVEANAPAPQMAVNNQ